MPRRNLVDFASKAAACLVGRKLADWYAPSVHGPRARPSSIRKSFLAKLCTAMAVPTVSA